jgi:peptidoglycan/LPS O-acetylase OafA/YrhL
MRLPELDGVRGLAILLVLIGHLFNFVMPEGAAVGVSLFFALSGYLITGILVREHRATGEISLRNFYWRRARRLLPPLVLFLGTFAMAAAAIGWSPRQVAQATLPVLFYSANWSGAAGWGVGHHMDHTWSLAVEEQFYIGWPLILPLVLILGRRAWMACVALALLVIGARYMAIHALGLPSDPIHTLLRYDEIMLGCALALAGWRFPVWAGVVALSGLLYICTQSGVRLAHGNAGYILIAVLCTCVVAGAAALRTLFSVAPLRHLGRISYSVYLWHFPIWVVTGNPWITLAASLLIAELSWRLLERPILEGRMFRWLSPPKDRDRLSTAASQRLYK